MSTFSVFTGILIVIQHLIQFFIPWVIVMVASTMLVIEEYRPRTICRISKGFENYIWWKWLFLTKLFGSWLCMFFRRLQTPAALQNFAQLLSISTANCNADATERNFNVNEAVVNWFWPFLRDKFYHICSTPVIHSYEFWRSLGNNCNKFKNLMCKFCFETVSKL